MHISELAHKNILIIGFAREGMATLTFLKKNVPSCQITITDTRPLNEFSEEAQTLISKHNPTLLLHEDYLSALEKFDIIIKIPSLSYLDPRIKSAVARGQKITSSTNIFYANTSAEMIAVTGSKGKSTTATLIYQILKASGKNVELIGNIGEPAIAYLGKETKDQLYVFEMSSYQLEDFHYAPHIAVFTSFFPDHIDHHGTLDEYFKAKSHIASQLQAKDMFIYNAASEKITSFASQLSCTKIPFNDESTSIIKEDGLYYKEEKIVDLSHIHLIGKHNFENILGVIACVKEYGVDNNTITRVLDIFTGLPHRLEYVGTYKEITFYNDAISTTPESTIAAIASMPQKVGTIILGGLDRGYIFDEIAEVILEKKINHVILFPDSGAKIWEVLQEKSKYLNKQLPSHFFAANMKECVQNAYAMTPKKSICLLSCASPSYSIFKNFEDKGGQFRNEVKKYSK